MRTAARWLAHRWRTRWRATASADALLDPLTPRGQRAFARSGALVAAFALVSIGLLDFPIARALFEQPELRAWAKLHTDLVKTDVVLPLALVTLVIGMLRRRPELALGACACALAVMLAGLAVALLKIPIGRVRPLEYALRGIYGFKPFGLSGPPLEGLPGAEGLTAWSFKSLPSGHSTTAGAVWCGLSWAAPRGALGRLWVGAAFVVFAGLASLRMLTWSHFLSDCVVGFYLGALTCGGVFGVFRRLDLLPYRDRPCPPLPADRPARALRDLAWEALLATLVGLALAISLSAYDLPLTRQALALTADQPWPDPAPLARGALALALLASLAQLARRRSRAAGRALLAFALGPLLLVGALSMVSQRPPPLATSLAGGLAIAAGPFERGAPGQPSGVALDVAAAGAFLALLPWFLLRERRLALALLASAAAAVGWLAFALGLLAAASHHVADVVLPLPLAYLGFLLTRALELAAADSPGG